MLNKIVFLAFEPSIMLVEDRLSEKLWDVEHVQQVL